MKRNNYVYASLVLFGGGSGGDDRFPLHFGIAVHILNHSVVLLISSQLENLRAESFVFLCVGSRDGRGGGRGEGHF